MKVLLNRYNNLFTVVDGDDAIDSKRGIDIRKALRKHSSSADNIRRKIISSCNSGLSADDSDTVVDVISRERKPVADEKVYKEIDDLVKQRQELGIKLSKVLKNNGLISADDSPTQTDLP